MYINNIAKHRSISQFNRIFIFALVALFVVLRHQVGAHENNIVHSGLTNL